MKIEVNITKKYFFILLGTLLVIGSGILAYALTPGVAPPNGHTVDQVAPPAGCSQGQVLSWSGSAWQCTTSSGWPAGHYCVVEATGSSCPSGFKSVNPSQAPNGELGGESELVKGSSSSTVNHNVKMPWNMNSVATVSTFQSWAWCCK